MRDGIRITIEEWAGDNQISLTPEQIEDLADGIEAEQDMRFPTGYGYDRLQHEESEQIDKLRNTIDLLARFIASKGYNICFDDKSILESVTHYSIARCVSTTKIFT